MFRFAALASLVCVAACDGTISRAGGSCATPDPKIRRLTRAEIDATYSDTLNTTVSLSAQLAGEDMQLGYFGHDSLQVTTLFADQLDSALSTLTAQQSINAAQKMGCQGSETENACARRYLEALATKAWRRPLASPEVDDLVAIYQVGRTGETQDVALALATQAVLESTGALYRTELGPEGGSGGTVQLTQWEIASELSYLATGGPPDDALKQAAAAGTLSKKEVRVEHLKRLLSTPQSVLRMRDFVEQWFGLTNMGKVQKNNAYFPKFNTGLRDTMADSAHKLMETALSSSRGSVSELLGADYTFANDELAQFLGSSERPGTNLMRISTTALPRRGLLTQPSLLAVFAHNDDGSPTLRGKLIRTRILCDNIPPPPPNVVASVAPVSPTATTRQRAEAHASNDTCKQCHSLMDNIGFGLEGYDGFGEFRTMESGQAIDDSGEIKGTDVAGTFKGAMELTQKLIGSKQVGDCATRQLTRFAIGRHETAADQCSLDLMNQHYADSRGSLYSALEGLVESDSFVQRTVSQ